MNISDYFNERCFGTFGPGMPAIFGAVSTGLLLYSGSSPAMIGAIAMAAFTVGKVNQWQEAAKGKPIWESKFKWLGL